jgi:hypothetical protein
MGRASSRAWRRHVKPPAGRTVQYGVVRGPLHEKMRMGRARSRVRGGDTLNRRQAVLFNTRAVVRATKKCGWAVPDHGRVAATR